MRSRLQVCQYLSLMREAQGVFLLLRQVLSPPGEEGVSPSSPNHRKILSPSGVEGALPSSPVI